MTNRFIHLRAHSAYSLLEGAIHVKALVKWCKDNAMPAVAMADHNNLFGSLEFSLAAMEEGIQPIQGCVVDIKPEYIYETRNNAQPEPDQLLIYAQNETGWHNLLALVSKAYLDPADGRAPLLSLDDFDGHSDGLIVLTSGIYGGVGKALLAGQNEHARAYLERLQSLFGDRLYIELMRHGRLREKAIEPHLLEMAYAYNIPLVATNDAYYIPDDMFEAHDAFLCISSGTYVAEGDRRQLNNEHRLKSSQAMEELFADIPEAIANTYTIAKRCSFLTTERAPMLPSFVEEGISEEDALRNKSREGLQMRLERYVYTSDMDEAQKAEIATEYKERLEFELDVIINMQFPGYFLIVSDFITWSKENNIPVGPGRGSGAGSLVAWSLQITDLDPLRFGLLFERFLNPERVSMPDFDIDFCQERREKVIQYVQQRYGADRVAQIITFGKLQARAVLRDVGRVLQMPYGQIDRISKLVPNNPANPTTLKEAIALEPMFKQFIGEDAMVKKLIDISLKLEGLYRHASTHAAGVVIADRSLSELVPLYRDPKSDMPVVQYSMKYAEKAGLVKFDFLGLKTLSVLARTLELLKPRDITLDLLALPEGDKPTYEMLGRGATVGVFQLESAGMRDTLKKLKPDTLEDIIALVSLYRPGPMDNIPTYIARKHGEENPEYLHPLLEKVLKETFGVIIYQEQVMQIAQLLAGYSLGEADLLRRAMGKKIRSEMEAQRDIFVQKSVDRGVERKQAKAIFDLIAKFAEYGFNKSHAAAYALIAYQTAFLKANYPVEFIAASMTYDMHNTDKLATFREDAQQCDIEILPPDINRSDVLFAVEGNQIFYALAAIRNVGEVAMEAVVAERESNGPYKDIFDFASRVPSDALNRRGLEHLIKAGAFDKLHTNRHQLFSDIERVIAYGNACQREKESQQESLFGVVGSDNVIDMPRLSELSDWSSLERLEHEYAAIGFYLSAHPLADYRSALAALNVVSSADFLERLGKQFKNIKIAGIVTGRKFKASDKGRFAFVQLSDLGGVYEVSIFNEGLLIEQRDNLENGKILVMQVDAKIADGVVRLIAQKITLFDDAVVKQQQRAGSANKYRIHVSNPDALASIRNVLSEIDNRGSVVSLLAQLEGAEKVEISLPGKYVVSPTILDKIRVIQGVDETEEISA